MFSPISGINVDIPHGKTGWILLVYFVIGCGSTQTSPPGSPMPTPQAPVINPSRAGSWTFNYAPGAMRYRVSRSAAVESQSDSGSNREITTNITHELITLTPAGDSGISFIAVVDTFSSTTQGFIGPVQPIQLPAEVSGIFANNSLTIRSNGSSNKCNPVSSAIVSDLHNLLTQFPPLLSQGLAWQDSVSTTGCQAAIPTTSRTVRSYIVSGESIYEGRPVLVIQRTDTVQAHGEGAQQQHALKLDAGGVGNAIYYLDTKDGRVVRLTTGQELTLMITASNKVHQFEQSSRQDFRLSP